MSSSGFFDVNTRRAYPFLFSEEPTLPDCAVVDFGSTMTGEAGYVEGLHRVWLEWIRLVGDVVEYSFRTDAPGLADQALIFQRSVNDPDFVTQFTWAQPALTVEQVEAPCDCGDNRVQNWDFDEAGVGVPDWTVEGSGEAVTSDGQLLTTTDAGEYVVVTQTITGLLGDERAKVFIQVDELSAPIILRVRDLADEILGQIVISTTGQHSLTVVTNDTQMQVQVVLHGERSAAIDFVTAHNCTADNQSYSAPPPDPELCQDEPMWEGYLVTGNLPCTLEYLSACQQVPGEEDSTDYLYLEGPVYLEPATTQALSGQFVRSIAIANADRTRATSPTDCRELCWPFEIREHYVACECVAGDVRFASGFNFNVRQETTDGAVVFDAEVGSGLGEPCEELPLSIDESAPPGRRSLSGSLLCGDVVRSINGISERIFVFEARDGVRLTSIPAQHRVIVDIDFNTLALCPGQIDPEPVECYPPSVDPCDCGPLDASDYECPEDAVLQTTTTAAPEPEQGGPCVWQSNGTIWTRVSGACGDGYDCVKPAQAAANYPPGWQLTTACFAEPEPDDGCLVINGDFTDPLGPFAGWGGGSSPFNPGAGSAMLVTSYEDIPASEMPMLLLEGTATGDGIMVQQTQTPSLSGLYRLEMDLRYIRGRCLFRVSSLAGTWEYELPENDDDTDYRFFISPSFSLTSGTIVTLEIIALRALTMTGRGALLFARPCLVHQSDW